MGQQQGRFTLADIQQAQTTPAQSGTFRPDQVQQAPPAPVQPPTWKDNVRSGFQSAGYGPHLELALGGLKSVLGTIEGGGNLIRSVLPDWLEGPSVTLPISTKPSNTGQTIGKTIGDTAQFLAPAGAIAAGAKGLQTGLQAGKAVGIGARAVGEGLSAAGIHSMQQGTTEGAGTVGALAAAGPLVGAAAGSIGRRMAPGLKEAAEKKVAQALGATKERFKALAAKRAPEILRRGLAGSRQGLLQDATEQASAAGKAIDDVLSQHAGVSLSTKSVIDALEEAKAGFITTRAVPAHEALQSGLSQREGARLVGNGVVEVPVVLDERVVDQLTKLQAKVRELGDEVPLDKLVALRRVWDGVVGKAGGYAHRAGGSNFGAPLAEQTETWAKKQGATALRKLFADNVQDLQKVNAEYAFWKDLKDILRATEARTQAQGPGLGRVVAAGVGATAGSPGGVQGALVGGYITPKVMEAITSPRWRLVSAHLKNNLADALASDSPEAISAALGRVLAAITSSSGGAR
jgi:hypothetical protein